MDTERADESREITGEWRCARGLQVLGSNAVEFLQGYLTCDLTRLQKTSTVPMALCNLKGRTVVSGWIHQHATDTVELIVHETLTTKLAEVLAPYARFSRCTLEANAAHPFVTTTSESGFIDNLHLLDEPLPNPSDVSSDIDRLLVASGFAWLTDATTERFLPQVLNLHNLGAVDFDKGCYLGQEIVARAQFRGQVKKELISFTWSGNAPAPGKTTEAGHTVVSVVSDPNTPGQGTGLAVT